MPDQIDLRICDSPVDVLPRFSGVYRFFAGGGELLYIGKSVDIHARVVSHFHAGSKPGRHQRIMSQVARIDCEPTAGEFGALLLENAAIKAETPLYNRRQRQQRQLWTIELNRDTTGFLKPTARDFAPSGARTHDSYGLFHNKKHIDSTLRRHARDQGLCLLMLGLEKGRAPCFHYQLKRCDGACAGDETAEEHNARLLSALDGDRIAAWPFPGPLLLREHTLHPVDPQPPEQFYWVNHWVYHGHFNSINSAQRAADTESRRRFDRDSYHLIMKALVRGQVEVLGLDGKPVSNPLLGVGRRRER
ncbi:nucleotide excision repair endonuclease [Luminiphilus syltensis]|nr:nucleotide excision repair endonuclease [Luminiphilus syltensis]